MEGGVRGGGKQGEVLERERKGGKGEKERGGKGERGYQAKGKRLHGTIFPREASILDLGQTFFVWFGCFSQRSPSKRNVQKNERVCFGVPKKESEKVGGWGWGLGELGGG